MGFVCHFANMKKNAAALKNAKGSKPGLRGLDAGNVPSIRDVLDAVPLYVMIVDEDHNIVEANKAVYRHLKVDRDAIIGQYCPRVIHGLNNPFPGCPLEESAEDNRAIERELFDKESGRWVRSAVYPVKGKVPVGKRLFLHMVHDITERKVAEEELKLSHQQLRALSAHLESVREEEKKKIARDLHDETSQLIAGLNAYLETAIRTLPADAPESKAVLKKARALTITILDDLHRLIYDLRPTLLDELGLVAAINSLADNYIKAAGVNIKVEVKGKPLRLIDTVETAIFRAVQEALTNILKHANASNVMIGINFKKHNLVINVRDDGGGFDADGVMSFGKQQGGLGLIGIKERMLLVNGSLKIKSGRGKGTEIVLDVPLEGRG
jgi:PAS domain S-box-containing protein